MVEQVAAEIGATPAQIALAWLLARGGDVVPIPGTRRSERVEENVGANAIELSAGQLNRLNDVEPPVGDRYADMTPSTADLFGRRAVGPQLTSAPAGIGRAGAGALKRHRLRTSSCWPPWLAR